MAIACSPATPAPKISTRDGLIVPAADMNIGKNLGNNDAASSTALYPETVAIDESISIDWALVVLESGQEPEQINPEGALFRASYCSQQD